VDSLVSEATSALDELRELTRGIHPMLLVEAGLAPALDALARRSATPVELTVAVEGRLPEQVEIAAYYGVSEALTNTAKHAAATLVQIQVDTLHSERTDVLRIEIRDDGRGSADLARGTGLLGLKDRIEALGGRILLDSPPMRAPPFASNSPSPPPTATHTAPFGIDGRVGLRSVPLA
jgi:signal transduction histidine kinase